MIVRRVQITQEHFDRFARLSGDHNPIHVDAEFAARTRFGRTLCHGMFLWSLLSEQVFELYGALPVAHQLKFPGPAYAGDTLALALEQVGPRELRGVITREDGTVSCEAMVLLGPQ